jgi:hypothetical protein
MCRNTEICALDATTHFQVPVAKEPQKTALLLQMMITLFIIVFLLLAK